jgi:type III secretion protein Q
MSMGTVSVPLVLPLLRRSETLAINQIVRQGKKHTVAIAGQDWQLSLEPWLNAAPVMPAGNSDWYAKLDWAGATIQISMPESVCQGWLKEAFPDLDIPALPQAFSAALLESLIANLIDSPALTQRGRVQLHSIGNEEPAQDKGLPHQFGIQLERHEQRIHLRLSADNLGLMLIAGLVGERQPDVHQANNASQLAPDTLPVTIPVRIGQSRLDLSEFSGLSRGDTILIADNWVAHDSTLWIGWDQTGFRVRISEEATGPGTDLQLIVTSPLEHKGAWMSADQSTETDPNGVLEDLPVRLDFAVGSLTLPLRDLNALQPGQVIELHRPLAQSVDIRVNGMLIGRGDLIEIDGQLGVTVSELLKTTHQAANQMLAGIDSPTSLPEDTSPEQGNH